MEDLTRSRSMPQNSEHIVHSKLDFPVVGLGASAGGVQALLRFFENMPADNGMAFVVILHLSPKHQSNASSVLQRVTKMPVVEVTKPLLIEKNHVYVISPSKQLAMNDGYLRIIDMERPLGQHVAIDLFFRTLADVHRERAIGIILSGTGGDGAVGLARLKEQGGITFAQQPDDAEHDGMPNAAISTGIVDFILPVIEMPQKLIDLWSNARIIQLPPVDDPDAPLPSIVSPDSGKNAEEALQDVIGILHRSTGHDFRHYKRATVLRRIERRMQVRGVANLPLYRDVLKTDLDESGALLKDMLIGVTNFFRDREAFETLERDVIPQLFADRKIDDQVRIWVTACSTGEEAYSLAMLLSDQANLLSTSPEIQVFATDIDDRAIAIARSGSYPLSIMTDVPPPRLREHFTKEETRYRIKKNIRDKVLFAAHNLLRDPPFSKLDLITCRNLLIYLNREVQSQVLEMFHFALNPGGFLFLGSSESADVVTHFFTPVDKKHRIYRAKTLPRSTRYAPSTMPFSGISRASESTTAIAPNKRKFSFADVHQRVLAQYAPPSVIVNHESNIVHMSDRAGRFLRHVGGEPSRNLVSLVQPELRLELRTALFQALQGTKSIETRRVQIKRDDRTYYVNMIVRPFHDSDAAGDFVLVLFDEIEEVMSDDLSESGGDKKDMVLVQLEEELQRTKEQLQDTIEHSETSTEELKASNEELQAINEELRSATEELETSKEELQSVNEELITVNYELKVKVEETGKVNDDLNNLIASTEIATVFIDRGMRIKRYTPRAVGIFSLIPSDIGRSLLDITHRLDYEHLADDALVTFETLRPIEREVRSADGRFYIARLLPYRTVEDRIDGAVLTFIDITARRQAEEKLRAGEERMRLVAESTKDYAIITCDTEGRITSFNKGAERIFGYTEDEVLGEMGDIIYSAEDRANGVPEDERRRAREDGRADDERWHIRKDGTRLYCSGVMTPLRDGDFFGYAKIARDQTDPMIEESKRQFAVNANEISSNEVKIANALKDEFLAIMSHELRHPLNLIHINTELLSRLPEIRNSPLTIKATEVIRSSVLSQAKIIDDLLDFSRLNTGKLTLTLSNVDLCMVVNSIADVVQSDPAASGVAISVTGIQEPLIIHADLVRVEQIIMNLLSNAVKFTSSGDSITIRLSREEQMARLDMTDTGKGIAPEFLPKIFDMFGQASPMTTRTKGGLGIGLALVRQITELHGGRVQALSAGLGQGSQFSVWFPLHNVSSSAELQKTEAPRRSIAGLSILLLDDMEDVVTGFKALLEFEGATVYTATKASDGLKILSEHDIDLVISDIAMPDMDGYTFIKEVRKHQKYAKVPAIAVTGMGRLKDAERAHEAGFSAHISKPVSIDMLIKTAAQLHMNTAPNKTGRQQ